MSSDRESSTPNVSPALLAAITSLLTEIDAEPPAAVGTEGWTVPEQKAFAAGWAAKKLRIQLAALAVRKALEA